MKRFTLVGMLFLAVSCAHQSTDRPSVNVAVTASPDAARMFDVDTFRSALQRELRGATLPTPRPLTLTVNIDSTDRVIDGPKASLASGRPIFWRTFFAFPGSDSVHGGADQSSGSSRTGDARRDSADYYTAFGGTYQKAHEEPAERQQTRDVPMTSPTVSRGAGQPVVVGTYTITDALGAVREQQTIVMLAAAPQTNDPRAQQQSMRSAAQYLADAVITVDAITADGTNLSTSRTH
jgi:hypothetical protein